METSGFAVLGIEPRASHLTGKCPITELYPQLQEGENLACSVDRWEF